MRYVYKQRYEWSANIAYLCGLFASDGDGYTYGYQDIRWANSFMYYVGFVSASDAFLKWLSSQNARLFGCSEGSINWASRAGTLKYAKTDSRKLFEAMYADRDGLRLGRKHDKLVAFLKADPYPSRS